MEFVFHQRYLSCIIRILGERDTVPRVLVKGYRRKPAAILIVRAKHWLHSANIVLPSNRSRQATKGGPVQPPNGGEIDTLSQRLALIAKIRRAMDSYDGGVSAQPKSRRGNTRDLPD